MRISVFVSFLLLLAFCDVKAQDIRQPYFQNISIKGGLFNMLGKRHFQPHLSGTYLSIQHVNYYHNDWGLRKGVGLVTGLEGVGMQYHLPFYLCYRTVFYREEISLDSFFDFFLSLFPRNYEINAGPAIGYISPEKMDDSGIRINDTTYAYHFKVDQNFYAFFDVSLKMKYKLGRLRIPVSLSLNRLLTSNYLFVSEISGDRNDGYRPELFVRVSIGLSYAF